MVVVPQWRTVSETAARIRSVTPKSKRITVQSLTSPSNLKDLGKTNGVIAVTSPSFLVRIDHEELAKCLRTVSLVVFEDLHLLDEQYELAITQLLSIIKPNKIRVVGIASSLNDPSDLASWLGVDSFSNYAFYPKDRGNPVTVAVKTFPLPHSATLLRMMTKPAYDVVKTAPGQTILFVPSRAACKAVANDMITQSGTEMDLNGFLTAPRADVEPLLTRLRDNSLHEPLLHGIGFLIPGAAPADMALVLELFASGVLRVLIAPRETCWTLPVRASTVGLMGAQYVTVSGRDGIDRRVVDYPRTEIVKMQGFAVASASHLAEGGRMFVMCQSEQAKSISALLTDGLPLESAFSSVLRRQSANETVAAFGRMLPYRQPPPRPQVNRRRNPDYRKRDVMDLLGWTYFARRIASNPTYYEAHRGEEVECVSRLVDEWFRGSADEYGPLPVIPDSTTSNTDPLKDNAPVTVTTGLAASEIEDKDPSSAAAEI